MIKALLITLLLVSVSFCVVDKSEKSSKLKTKLSGVVNSIKAANKAKVVAKEAKNTRNLKTIGCTSDDEAAMAKLGGGKGDNSFAGTCASCGKSAYSVWSGFDVNAYRECMVRDIKISESCAKCFEAAGKYGADNCKSKCMFGWNSTGCLSCTNTAGKDSRQCAGVKVPLVE